MKKTINLSLGAMLISCIASNVYAVENFLNYTSVSITGTYTKVSNNGLSYSDLQFIGPLVDPFIGTNDRGRRAVFMDPNFKWDGAFEKPFILTSEKIVIPLLVK